MTDFTYDSEDLSGIKVAFKNFKQSKRIAYYFGVLTTGFFAGSFLLFKNNNKQIFSAFSNTKIGIYSLLAGSFIYYFYTISAGNTYYKASSILNRKYSTVISDVLDYE